ncbi:hypothetical protein F511_32069 [Dorcoceras hygrometricum]|uniref:DNA glycosylase superfamily protein n=1 Tax=Dorcoceras hygrometricum TaxID=472368 RepID=A0A2Z7AD04_9LAMI|nr:hypothetical protein F511_32069 [Dorcoceras hygrometricum]
MSGAPRVKSMNAEELEARPVLVPAGNKARSVELRKPISKLKSLSMDEVKGKKSPATLPNMETKTEKASSPVGLGKNAGCTVSILRQRQQSLSLNVSCSSDASSESSQSRASTGKISRRSATPITPPMRGKQMYSSKMEKFGRVDRNGKDSRGVIRKRCAWVTSNTDSSYAAFHDEEWGLPVHSDNKLFELLSYSTALAELTWPVILSKRLLFREVFMNFDPVAVSKLNDKKISTPGSPASSLLSELKLRGIIENARQICKIVDELGSFDRYIWGFVNYKPIVGNYRYPRQVPIKTSKADTISKDLVRRGFRGVGPTAVYSFMQVAGITNDHLISCFRHQQCINPCDSKDMNEGATSINKDKRPDDISELDLAKDIDDLGLSM